MKMHFLLTLLALLYQLTEGHLPVNCQADKTKVKKNSQSWKAYNPGDAPADAAFVDTSCGKAIKKLQQSILKNYGEDSTGYNWANYQKKKAAIMPNPTEYFAPQQVIAHLKLFDNGGSYLVAQSGLEWFSFGGDVLKDAKKAAINHALHAPNNVGAPGGLFFSTKDAITNLIVKAKKEKKPAEQLKLLEDALGLPSKSWSGKATTLKLLRVDIPKSQYVHLRMASGGESCANEKWNPGGYLPGNMPEAISDPVKYGRPGVTITVIFHSGKFDTHPNLFVPHGCEKCKQKIKPQCGLCKGSVQRYGLALCDTCLNAMDIAAVDQYNVFQDFDYASDDVGYSYDVSYNAFMANKRKKHAHLASSPAFVNENMPGNLWGIMLMDTALMVICIVALCCIGAIVFGGITLCIGGAGGYFIHKTSQSAKQINLIEDNI